MTNNNTKKYISALKNQQKKPISIGEKWVNLIPPQHINYCIAYFIENNKCFYLESYQDKKILLINKLSSIISKRKFISSISDLKRILRNLELQHEDYSWINFSDKYQLKWIRSFLNTIDDSNSLNMLHEYKLNKEDYLFSIQEKLKDINIKNLNNIYYLREKWARTYNNTNLNWIEPKNKTQMEWIYSYIIKNIDTESLKLSTPTNNNEKNEYLKISLSLIEHIPELIKNEDNQDPIEFINRMKKSWQVNKRRSLKSENTIYKSLSIKRRNKLNELSEKNKCSESEMIEKLIDAALLN